MSQTKTPGLACFHCDVAVGMRHYCHGCGHSVCDGCNSNPSPVRGHEPTEHLDPPEDPDEVSDQ